MVRKLSLLRGSRRALICLFSFILVGLITAGVL